MTNIPLKQRPHFVTQQVQFTAYMRDPQQLLPLDVKPARLQLYAELLFNNIESFLGSNFPVLKSILSAAQWLQLVRDFYSSHRCESPYFADIPQAFLTYLQDERLVATDLPFMLELAHYEWVEMALSIAPETVVYFPADFADALADQIIQLSPLAWPLAYEYPVQQISPDYMPDAPPETPTCLCVYRDNLDEVRFLQIAPLTYQLLAYLQTQGSQAATACLTQFITEFYPANASPMLEAGFQTFNTLAAKGIIIPS